MHKCEVYNKEFDSIKGLPNKGSFSNNKLNFIELIEFDDMIKFIVSLKGE